MCVIPRAPPPDSTTPIRGRLAGAGGESRGVCGLRGALRRRLRDSGKRPDERRDREHEGDK